MNENSRSPVKLAVIGAGHMGSYHINICSLLPEAELVAVVDKDPEKLTEFEERYGIATYTDYREIIDKAEAAIVATPTSTHYGIAKELLEKGIHLLVEKPLTIKSSEAEELFALARKNKLVLMSGHVERFNGAVQELGKIVKSPYIIEARRLGPYNSRIKDIGVVLDLMIHDIDIVLSLVGEEIKKINASGGRVKSPHEDYATALIEFQNGTVAVLTASRVTEDKVRTLAITQEDAYIFLDYADQDILVIRSGSSGYFVSRQEIRYTQAAFIERIYVHKENPLKLEIQHFLKRVQEKDYQNMPEKELRALRVAEKILSELKS